MEESFKKTMVRGSFWIGTILVLVCGRISSAEEKRILTAGDGSRVCAVTRSGHLDGLAWVELHDEATGLKFIVPKADHYVMNNSTVITVANYRAWLRLTRSMSPGEFERGLSFYDRARVIGWNQVFGLEATVGDASSRYLAQIRDVKEAGGGISIEVVLPNKSTGVMTLDSELKLVSVKLGNRSVPILNQITSLAHREEPTAPISRESIVYGGREVEIWKRVFDDGDAFICEAKLRLDGKEITWIGPHLARWMILDEQLIGVAVRGEEILIRVGRPSELVSAAGIKRLAEAEERLFSSHLIPLAGLITEKLEGVSFDEVKSVNGLIDVSFSASTASSLVTGELSYSMTRHEAFLRVGNIERRLTEPDVRVLRP